MAEAVRPGSNRKVPKLRHLPFVDLFHVDILYERLLVTGWSAFPTEPLQHIVNLIGSVRENLLLVQRLWEKVERGDPDKHDIMSALLKAGEAVSGHKAIFVKLWDDLIATLSKVKLQKSPRPRKRTNR